MTKLLKHFEAMQTACAAYVCPDPYMPLHGHPEGAPPYVSEASRDRAFANDMIYMLDGPEQREAQAAAVEDAAGMEQAAEWRMDIRKQVEQADAATKLTREHAREMEKRNADLQKQVEALQHDRSSLQADVARLGGMLDMLRELGTIPKQAADAPAYYAPHGGYSDASRRY